ncbi:MAG TPA: AMP-binding protein [Candidatus Acidoferrales bacterium]|nr:AMP-binding protein [Candidatus Acidoferrales bacterium]
MARDSLIEYFKPDSRPAQEAAVAWRRGYRTIRWSYADLYRHAAQFAQELDSRMVGKGDRVLIWGENSGEWIAAFLGCMLRGAIAVPMDAIADRGFAARVARQAGVKLTVAGRDLPVIDPSLSTVRLDDLTGLAAGHSVEGFAPTPASRKDAVEIVFTSGTTAEPRGVVLTHGNLLANLEPIEEQIQSYRRYEKFFHPLRFLDLLPLSHVFGQLLGIFLPQILGATSIFVDTLNPADVARTIHNEKVSVLVAVPRLIESLRDQIERDLTAAGGIEKFRRRFRAAEGTHFLHRWWIFRRIRRRFGWKFWAMISGGAALPAAAEQFWTRLGYAVIQGYGLTETTSLVSVNHPFHLSQGSIGKSLPGLEVKLASDAEILVRGENVASGYWNNSGVEPVLDAEGWFHTGDLGEQGPDGTLYFKGRRKNVIVTPEGLNVYPEDLEAELRNEPGVRDCVVIGLERDGNAVPCAVLLLRDTSGGAQAIVEGANERLAPFQQMRHWYVWPAADFPRTPTQKPVLKEIAATAQRELSRQTEPVMPDATSSIEQILKRISGGASASAGTNAKLQLSSIERVELLGALEDRYQIDLSETDFTKADSLRGLEKLVETPPEAARGFHFPRWAQTRPVQWLRTAAFYLLQRPAMLVLGWPRVVGRKNLRGVRGPALIISNHIAYFDPAYILAALPVRFRNRLAVAMDGELLETMRTPPEGTPYPERIFLQAQWLLVTSVFNVFPLPRHSGFRKSFAFAGDLVDRGWNVLVFPEGVRTKDGVMNPFQGGIGLLATRLRAPVIPMRLDGIFERKIRGKHWAPPGSIRVTVGKPVPFDENAKPEELTRELERRVAALGNPHETK